MENEQQILSDLSAFKRRFPNEYGDTALHFIDMLHPEELRQMLFTTNYTAIPRAKDILGRTPRDVLLQELCEEHKERLLLLNNYTALYDEHHSISKKVVRVVHTLQNHINSLSPSDKLLLAALLPLIIENTARATAISIRVIRNSLQ